MGFKAPPPLDIPQILHKRESTAALKQDLEERCGDGDEMAKEYLHRCHHISLYIDQHRFRGTKMREVTLFQCNNTMVHSSTLRIKCQLEILSLQHCSMLLQCSTLNTCTSNHTSQILNTPALLSCTFWDHYYIAYKVTLDILKAKPMPLQFQDPSMQYSTSSYDIEFPRRFRQIIVK